MPMSETALVYALKTKIPSVLHAEVKDVSSGCGASYEVVVVSSAFEGKVTLGRHRLVNDALKEEIGELHAFSQVRLLEARWRIKEEDERVEVGRVGLMRREGGG